MNVTLLLDDKHSVYAVDEGSDRNITRGSYAGGFGGGSILPTDTAITAAVPFCLNLGDKTLVQMQKLSGDDDGPKHMSGTVYSILRLLEAKGHHDVQITKYGKAVPKTVDGQRCYEFPDMSNEQNFDYILSGATNTTGQIKTDNFFRSGVCFP